ncbi:MAG: hypothetical protein AUJ57_01655 [Zetaproteobacteria bacterium CG1_02_53_45]|nr:MAG: hypothetical protein AUJ57_01655 [Zetaproteobacteria bacterium CG1_02_53_45]
MRKVVAVFLTWSLLIISSAPLSVEVADCAMPDFERIHEQGMDEHAHHMNHDASVSTDQGHEHRVALMSDWQTDRIECGCGCHRNIDSLPHLLAPHAISSAGFQAGVTSVSLSVKPAAIWLSAAALVPLPPPQLV